MEFCGISADAPGIFEKRRKPTGKDTELAELERRMLTRMVWTARIKTGGKTDGKLQQQV